MSSTGCKHSSVIDMKGHQEIGASLASKQKNTWSYVRLNFLSELYFHGCIVHYQRKYIKKAKDTQSICQCIVPSYNQSNKQSQSMFKQSFNQSDNQTSKGVNQSNIERTEMVNEPKMINKAWELFLKQSWSIRLSSKYTCVDPPIYQNQKLN